MAIRLLSRCVFFAFLFFTATTSFCAAELVLVPQVSPGIYAEIPVDVHFSPDGKWLASVSEESDVYPSQLIIYNTKGEIWYTTGQLPNLEALAWSSDSRYLALCGPDDAVIFDMQTARIVARTQTRHVAKRGSYPPLITFIDNQRVAFTYSDRGDICMWN